jgi:SRSO17 transposase
VAGEPKVKLRKPPPTPEQIIARRAASRIPDQVRYAPKWQLALDMVDELAGWGRTPGDAVLIADAGYGQVGAFRQGLSERGVRYVVAVVSTTTVHPAAAVPEPVPYAGVGKHPRARYRQDPVSVKTFATTTDPADPADPARRQVRWREAARSTPGKRVWMSGWFTATRVRPAGREVKRDDDGSYPEAWLLTQWPDPDTTQATEPTDYWLSDLPADTTLDDLVALAKARWRIEHDYRELKTALGLDHFEGRSWNGWHRHVTLVTAAHLFITTQRLTRTREPGKALGQNRT